MSRAANPRLLCGAALLLLRPALAAEPDPRQLEFNSTFLRGGAEVDIARFSRGNVVLAGDYLVDLHINGMWTSRATVRFIGDPGDDIARPCIDRALFDRIGVDLDKLPEAARAGLQQAAATECLDVPGLIQDAMVVFELSQLRLDISVPQATLARAPRDFVDPQYWDSGVPSATLGYNLNAYRTSTAGRSTNRGHVDLLAGANYGSWHLRHRAAAAMVSGGSTTYTTAATYLAHDIPAIRSNLWLGDSFTDGAVFDSFGFRGISLASSDQMLPESRREFAPVVRGIARTNARVVITQNGVGILETVVSPGAFEIDDLYATGYGGDLDVVVHEADGSQQRFVVPYSPMAQLLRAGVWRYHITAGSLRQPATPGSELFSQATLQHGINSGVTGYVGAIGAEHYAAGMLGAAFNSRVGALSVDITRASTAMPGAAARRGQGVRLGYSKLLTLTDTSITLAAYPYLSRGYYSLVEAEVARQAALAGGAADAGRMRRQWQVGVNQSLPGRWGNFFLSAGVREFHESSTSTTQLQGGYSNQLRIAGTRLSYGIAIAQQEDPQSGDRDRRLQVNFSLPLGRSPRAPTLSTSYVQNTIAGERTRGGQAVLIGSAGENRQLNYSLTASRAAEDSAYAVNSQYRGAYSSVSASLGKGSGYSQQSLGAGGGVVIHPGGITLSNQLTDTFGIVEAAGAAGARVTNSIGTVVNSAGFAVLPFLLPYRMNSINIDPEGAVSADVEFKSTTVQVAPRLNSVVMVHFETVAGRAILITARRQDGTEVPFGASVQDAQGSEVGLAGQGGRIYLRGIAEAGTLTARWGDAPDEQCAFTYRLPARKTGDELLAKLDVVCGAMPTTGRQP
jgi:outer membrane usher protein